jgi:integrase
MLPPTAPASPNRVLQTLWVTLRIMRRWCQKWLAQYAASAKPTVPLVPPGAPLLVVARALGHATTRMTEMHYAHLSPNFEDPVVTQLRKR